jgi:hypothetical protein
MKVTRPKTNENKEKLDNTTYNKWVQRSAILKYVDNTQKVNTASCWGSVLYCTTEEFENSQHRCSEDYNPTILTV